MSALVPPAEAAPGSLASARQKAAALEARIEAQGEQLSIADEQFNAAGFRRARLVADLTKTKKGVAASERRYTAFRDRLGRRARALYMHPGAPLEAWFAMHSIDQIGRQRVLSDAVLTVDSQLVSGTDRARRELNAKLQIVTALSADAEQTERTLAGLSRGLSSQLGRQRALLSSVRGDIARIIAADRARQLAEARRNAALSPGGSGSASATSDADLPPPPLPKPGAAKAVAVARAQIGKPYKWGAARPDSFDCSGLTMYAWAAAGVQLVHYAGSQYDMLPKVPRNQLQPGDLVFFGNPIHHEGIYEGGGIMIDAPQTGENVRRDSIYRADYTGASRP